MRLKTLLTVVFACLAFALCAQEPPANLRLFLLIGQSNMAGRGHVEPQDQETNSLIFMLNRDYAWVPAKDPLHFDKPAAAGVGLASQFARDVLKADPTHPIGLIPCAFGGTSLNEWKPGAPLYTNAVARTRAALSHGTLAGILWHQGEADHAAKRVATYPDRFAAMIAGMKKDIGVGDVPILVGELGRYRTNFLAFNAMLPSLTGRVSNCAIVSSEGLKPKTDNLHFDSPSLRTFGSRYAEALLKLQPARP